VGVTIIAGFKAKDGVVVCADTQETRGKSKRNVPKVVFQPSAFSHGCDADLVAAFCGAGEGPLIDKLIAKAWKDAKSGSDLDDVCQKIEDSITSEYQGLMDIYSAGFIPDFHIIYGIKKGGKSKLFYAAGPIVVEKADYATAGEGADLAGYLIGRFGTQSPAALSRCVVIAAYILEQAKQNVQFCGGESHVAILNDKGLSGIAGSTEIDAITQTLNLADSSMGSLLMQVADFTADETSLEKRKNRVMSLLNHYRELGKKKLEGDLSHKAALDALAGRQIVERQLWSYVS
jgi:20S proteasome alpha/beta subunit